MAATVRQTASRSLSLMSVKAADGVLFKSGLSCWCSRTMLTPRLAKKRACRARSGAPWGQSGRALSVRPATLVLTAQKRSAWPSPRTKSPSALLRTKPVSPATFSLSDRRSSRDSALKVSRGGEKGQVLSSSRRETAAPAHRPQASANANHRSVGGLTVMDCSAWWTCQHAHSSTKSSVGSASNATPGWETGNDSRVTRIVQVAAPSVKRCGSDAASVPAPCTVTHCPPDDLMLQVPFACLHSRAWPTSRRPERAPSSSMR